MNAPTHLFLFVIIFFANILPSEPDDQKAKDVEKLLEKYPIILKIYKLAGNEALICRKCKLGGMGSENCAFKNETANDPDVIMTTPADPSVNPTAPDPGVRRKRSLPGRESPTLGILPVPIDFNKDGYCGGTDGWKLLGGEEKVCFSKFNDKGEIIESGCSTGAEAAKGGCKKGTGDEETCYCKLKLNTPDKVSGMTQEQKDKFAQDLRKALVCNTNTDKASYKNTRTGAGNAVRFGSAVFLPLVLVSALYF